MRVLQVSTNELEGGAARAANRLHQALRHTGVDSQMLVQARSTLGCEIHSAEGKLARGMGALRPTLDQLPLLLQPHSRVDNFYTGWFPDRIFRELQKLKPDILHLHWVAKGFLRVETLRRIDQPVVWTLHDMWPFTGGCTHSWGCEKYKEKCGACPQLTSTREADLSRWIWDRKKSAWLKKPDVLICPSRWMYSKAAESSLFSAKTILQIPGGLDTSRFQPVDHAIARQLLDLPQNTSLALFSAVSPARNRYKGFDQLARIFREYQAISPQASIELVIMGDVSAEDCAEIPVPVHRLGRLEDEISKALVFAAADLLLAPSEADNSPLVVMEALSCGTPVNAYAVGGIPEMIDHQKSGWLAQPGQPAEMARGIAWILSDKNRWFELSSQARRKALDEYDLPRHVQSILAVYQELLAKVKAESHA